MISALAEAARWQAVTAYGTGKFLGWLVKTKKIIPYIPVWEKSDRQNRIFSRSDFHWDRKRGAYICLNGKLLKTSGTVHGIHLAKTTGMMLGSYGKEFRLLPQACFSCGLASSSTVAIHRSVSRDDREG